MSIPHPGFAYLSARALLEYPCTLSGPGHSSIVIFDAVIRPAHTTVSNFCCSLQYTKRRSEQHLQAGIYEVVAKVVAFERDTHPRSPVRYESEFLLMGDIMTVLFYHSHKDIAKGEKVQRQTASKRLEESGKGRDITQRQTQHTGEQLRTNRDGIPFQRQLSAQLADSLGVAVQWVG
ncbi:hypothetical protein EDB83DRAFT_2317156 [Lactarius deliciosus]|nr:hypothetical protein EDB83DRAFT_2317156 [Lactarius deliciosus]